MMETTEHTFHCSIETAYELMDENHPHAIVKPYPNRLVWINGYENVGVYEFAHQAFKIII